MIRRILVTSFAAALVGSALVAGPGSAVSDTVTIDGGSRAPSKDPRDLRVMTLNLYLGATIRPALVAAEKSLPEFLTAVAGVYREVQATDYPRRARWIARTIAQARPDVVTLNEVTDWEAESSTGVDLPEYHFLPTLRSELRKQGMRYRVAARVRDYDIGLSKTTGMPYVDPDVPGCDDPADLLACTLRMKDSDVVLYNARARQLRVEPGSARQGNYSDQMTFTVAGVTNSFNRGWASARFRYRGVPTSVITSHIEIPSQDGRSGRLGPVNWPSAIQLAQGRELKTIARSEAARTGGRVIVAGDLNSDANGYFSPTYGLLTSSFLSDTWDQLGLPSGPAVGATCCQTSDLADPRALANEELEWPMRIDLVLTHGADARWAARLGTTRMGTSGGQPRWQSDHYFYAADVRLRATKQGRG